MPGSGQKVGDGVAWGAWVPGQGEAGAAGQGLLFIRFYLSSPVGSIQERLYPWGTLGSAADV